MNPQEHIAAALDFLGLTDDSVSRQRVLLRSELFWCAAAHAVKAVAKQQDWPNRSHDDLFDVVDRLANDLNDARLSEWFKYASRLHRNMYEGRMSQRAISESEKNVRRLVHRLAEMVN